MHDFFLSTFHINAFSFYQTFSLVSTKHFILFCTVFKMCFTIYIFFFLWILWKPTLNEDSGMFKSGPPRISMCMGKKLSYSFMHLVNLSFTVLEFRKTMHWKRGRKGNRIHHSLGDRECVLVSKHCERLKTCVDAYIWLTKTIITEM